MFGRRRDREADDDKVVIDLTDHVPASDELAFYDLLVARRQAQAARREAERELAALRARFWSGDRILEEAAAGIEAWEHHRADPYAVLSIEPGATLDAAAAARKRIARTCHPDVAGADPRAARRMAAANNAYDRLRRAMPVANENAF